MTTAELICQQCASVSARRYQLFTIGRLGEPGETQEFALCVRCARAWRRADVQTEATGLTRAGLLHELDRFFAASGALEICRRCHEQGTGCCPPTCRKLGAQGCGTADKTVWCAAFVCGALLNAISEYDAQAGRVLKRVKQEIGPVEFHVYEMFTRVPAAAREPVQPLSLPQRYPELTELGEGSVIKDKLLALADEVLEIRRRWQALERLEPPEAI